MAPDRTGPRREGGDGNAQSGSPAALRSAPAVVPLLAAVLLGARLPGQDDGPLRVPVGERVTIELDGAPSRRLVVVPELDGPLTIEIGSADADPHVRRLGPDGAPRAEDDDGGVEWNARLVVEAAAGEEVHLLAGVVPDGGGAVRLGVLVRAGDRPAPEGVELAQARADFFLERGRSLLARGRTLDGALALQQAAELDHQLGQLVRCRATYESVRELAVELGHEQLRIVSLARLGGVLVEFDRPSAARDLLQEAVDGAVAMQHAPLELYARHTLGLAHQALGDLAAARACAEAALDCARRTGDRANEVALCSRMGELAWRRGERDDAATWHARALALAGETRTTDGARPLTTALLEAGRFHAELGEQGRARACFEEALALAPTPHLEAQALGELGNVALHTGDELGALERFERVLDAGRLLGDVGLESDALVSLGLVHDRLGDWARARRRLEEALALMGAEATPAKRAEALRTLALVAMESGDLDGAGRALDEAAGLVAGLTRAGLEPRLEARVLAARVGWHYRRGEYRAALEPARRVRAIGVEHELVDVECIGLDQLAELWLRLDDPARAGELAPRAVELGRALDDPSVLQWALLTSVELAWRRGDARAMARIVGEAEACFARLDAARFEPEKLALLRAQDVFALWSEYGQELAALEHAAAAPGSADRRRAVEQGFRRAGRWKARALLQAMAEHRRGARGPDAVARRRELEALAGEKDALLEALEASHRGAEGAGGGAEALRERIRRLAAREDELAAGLRRRAALDVPESVGSDELDAALDGGELLVEYAAGKERLYAYVLRGGELRFHDLGRRDRLEAEVAAYVDGISRPERLASVAAVARRGRSLYDALLAPVVGADVAAGAASPVRLVVVPTAALAALPLEALVVDAPGEPRGFDELAFVLDRCEVRYASSTPILAFLAELGPRATPGAALILADALHAPAASEPDALAERARPWVRLPGTRSEALAVAEAIRSARPDVGRTPSATPAGGRSLTVEDEALCLYTGAAATPDRLRGDLRRFAIVHVASHGFVDPVDPNRSGLVLSPGADGDGTLRVADVLELDLDADLAVLSACETGSGGIQRAEGVQSIARAFLYAGARSVVASLWPVDDRETEAVMRRFYAEHLLAGSTRAAALRTARLAVRGGAGEPGAYRGVGRGVPLEGGGAAGPAGGAEPPARDRVGHPFFWASFVYRGLAR